MKFVATKLMKMHEDYLKPKSIRPGNKKDPVNNQATGFEFLMPAIASLQTENSIPIVVFNPL